MNGFYFIILSWVVVSLSMSACTADSIPPQEIVVCDTLTPVYSVQVKPIVDASCAYTDCHVSGTGNGDFSEYTSLVPALESGQFSLRVFEVGDMPPNNVPTEQQLSEQDLEMLQCWIDAGYPEF